MKNIFKYALLALVLISTTNVISQITQENDTIISVNLDEVVVSTPFKESLKKPPRLRPVTVSNSNRYENFLDGRLNYASSPRITP